MGGSESNLSSLAGNGISTVINILDKSYSFCNDDSMFYEK